MGALDGSRDRPGESRFSGPRGVFEKQVAPREHRREGEADDVVLAQKRTADVADDSPERLREPRGVLLGHLFLLLSHVLPVDLSRAFSRPQRAERGGFGRQSEGLLREAPAQRASRIGAPGN